MKLHDDGTVFTTTTEPWLISKIFSWLFLGLAILFPLMLIASLLMPPKQSQIDCSRPRGTCQFTMGARHYAVPIGEIIRAEMRHRRGTRNSSPYDYAVVMTRTGGNFDISEAGYHDSVTNGFRAAVAALNRFAADPSQPTFTTSFRANDNDWMTLVFFTLVLPFAAWAIARRSVRRVIEIDRRAREIRVLSKPIFRRTQSKIVPFTEITALGVIGFRWTEILLASRDGTQSLLYVPRIPSFRAYVQEFVSKYSQATGAAVDASEPERKFWGI